MTMNKSLKNLLLHLLSLSHKLGLDIERILSYRFYLRFRKDKSEWIKQGGKITHNHMILTNYSENAGEVKGHYFHQDLLVARLVYEQAPNRHVDIGSRIDGFVAHVASYREIEVLDVRPLSESKHANIKFLQADLMQSQNLGDIDSVSCLHAIEHFGMGRYTDPIDVNGHIKGISNLVNLVSVGGRLYISFPIGKTDEIHFNANRVFHPTTIFEHPSIKKYMKLIRFDYVDDNGDLQMDKDIKDISPNIVNGCGIYSFERIK